MLQGPHPLWARPGQVAALCCGAHLQPPVQHSTSLYISYLALVLLCTEDMCRQQQASFAAVESNDGSQLQQQGRSDQLVLQVRLSLAAVHNGMWLDSK